MNGDREKSYAYWLCTVPGLGGRSFQKLMDVYRDAEAVYRAGEGELTRLLKPQLLESLKAHRAQWQPASEYARLKESRIGFLTCGEPEYPQRLQSIPDAPPFLFYKGRLPEDDVLSVAVIGARDCSDYGHYVARSLGEALGSCGIQVISGMARGVDGISQQAALQAGGYSCGVLGCGVDICYPSRNRALYELLLERGGVLSAYVPGSAPKPQNFPPRNRFVSGLADAVVVVEAREKSGTLITVDMALEQGREVFVVPGRVTDRLSDGCNRLLKQGAGLLLSPEDFVRELRESFPARLAAGGRCETAGGKAAGDGQMPLSGEMRKLWQLLDLTPQSAQQLRSRLAGEPSPARLNSMLMKLCMDGFAVQAAPGYYCAGERGR